MTKTIAVVNQKGGVAKTTTVINLARALIEGGKKVACIDFDPQASLTDYYGFDSVDLDDENRTVYNLLKGEKELGELLIPASQDHPAFVPSTIRLAQADIILRDSYSPGSMLKKRLNDNLKFYDYVLIDCAPTLSLLTVNAMGAADFLLIPVKTERISVRGIELLLPTIFDVTREVNPFLKIMGVLPTVHNPNFEQDRLYLNELKEGLEPDIKVFRPIERSTNFDKAAHEQVSAVERFPELSGVQAYRELASYIIKTYGWRHEKKAFV